MSSHGRRGREGVLIVFLVAFASGCLGVARGLTPLAMVDRNVRFDRGSGDALVVFALTPNMVVTLSPGRDDGVSWHCGGREWPVRVRPQDGFVVAWLRPKGEKKSYAITKFATDASELTAWRTATQVLTFEAVPGQVTYLGALRVEFEGGRLSGIATDPDITDLQAEAFMAGKFPNVSAPLAKGRTDWAYLGSYCN